MAHATKITIATGTTAYAGDPECDDGISSREVRVEVTYRLEPGEDATLAAMYKTREVERTRRIVWESIVGPSDPSIAETAADLEPSDAMYTEQDCDDPRIENAAPFPLGAPYAVRYGEHPVGRESSTTGNDASVVSPEAEPVELATRPQVLAIRSHFARLGMSKGDQASFLRQSFDMVFEELLTKVEAAQLMRALERGDWQAAQEPVRSAAFVTVH